MPRRHLPPRPGRPYQATLLTRQWRVEAALLGKLAELGGQVEFGVSLASHTQDPFAHTKTRDEQGNTWCLQRGLITRDRAGRGRRRINGHLW